MTATSKHPGEDVLREMAARPGMTFARIARKLAVDRKTVRRWCRDIGIDECGMNGVKSETVLAEGGKNGPVGGTDLTSGDTGRSESENVIPEDNVVEIIQALQNKQAWLTEWLTVLHEEIRSLREAMSGVACPLPAAQVQAQPVDQPHARQDTGIDLYAAVMKIAFKLGAGEELGQEEQAIYDDLAIICRDALKEDVKILSSRIENHWHTVLSIAGSKEMARERRNGEGNLDSITGQRAGRVDIGRY